MSTSASFNEREEGLAFQPKFDAAGLLTCVATDAATYFFDVAAIQAGRPREVPTPVPTPLEPAYPASSSFTRATTARTGSGASGPRPPRMPN